MGHRNIVGTWFLVLQLSLWLVTALCGEYSWNILDYIGGGKKKDVKMSLKNYCESWRLNVELNNIRNFDSVPGECVDSIDSYMKSAQYKADLQRTAEESALFVTDTYARRGDGKDAWIFDVDDTLLSNVPYYRKHNYGSGLGCRCAETNRSSLESWMEERNAPVVKHIQRLYDDIRGRGHGLSSS